MIVQRLAPQNLGKYQHYKGEWSQHLGGGASKHASKARPWLARDVAIKKRVPGISQEREGALARRGKL